MSLFQAFGTSADTKNHLIRTGELWIFCDLVLNK